MSPGVRVKDGESFERALRRWKRRLDKSEVLSDLRKHAHYKFPSEYRKRKRAAARRKIRKLKLKQRKQEDE